MAEFTTKDVKEFISTIITTGGVLDVGDDDMIRWIGDEEPITVELDGGGKGILHTYTTSAKHPDAVLINPFAENVTITADRNWFYKTTSVIFSKSLSRCMGYLLEIAASGTEENIDPELIPILKPIAGKVDEKLLAEFDYINKNGYDGFCSIVYNNRAKETRLFLGIEDPTGDYQKAFPASKVRKRSWQILQDLLKAIFQTTGPVAPEYTVSTPLLICPQFRTYTEVWVKCWKQIAPILAIMGAMNEEDVEKVDKVEEHLERMDVYHKMCRWAVQASVAKNVKSTIKKTTAPGTTGSTERTSVQDTPKAGSRWDTKYEQPAPNTRWGTPGPEPVYRRPELPAPMIPQQQYQNCNIPVQDYQPGSRWSTPRDHYDPYQHHPQVNTNVFGGGPGPVGGYSPNPMMRQQPSMFQRQVAPMAQPNPFTSQRRYR